MNVKAALIEYMKEHNFTGLVSDSCECGCEIDDLMPCEGDRILHCELGHKVDEPPDDGSECEWSIKVGPKPPELPKAAYYENDHGAIPSWEEGGDNNVVRPMKGKCVTCPMNYMCEGKKHD